MTGIKKYAAEFFGTFVLVLFACGAAACGIGTTGIALAFGLVIVAMAYSIGNISGCHINPAVSLAMFLDGRLSLNDLLGYIFSQILGAIAGSGVLAIIFGDTDALAACSNYYIDTDMIFPSFLLEVILTFVFVFVILRVTSEAENSKISGIIIGLTLTLVHLFGISLTGTSVNPARSLGPAIFAGGDALEQVWLFLLAPLVGGVLAAFAFKALKPKKEL